MEQIVYKIGLKSETILKSLVEREIQLIYSGGFLVTYGSGCIESKEIFLSIKDYGYVKIFANWFECQKTLDDFYSFCLSTCDAVNKQDIASLFSFYNTSKISEISIYTKIEEHDEYEIKYDAIILIRRNDNKRICLTGGESAFRKITLFYTDDAIDSLLHESNVEKRKVL